MLDTKIEKTSFRRAVVVQEKLIDQEGRTFLFEINNIRIFCGGEGAIELRNLYFRVLIAEFAESIRFQLDPRRLLPYDVSICVAFFIPSIDQVF